VVLAARVGCRKAPHQPAEVCVRTHTNDKDERLWEEYGITKGKPRGAVLVLHGDYGLDGTIQGHARRLARQGYLVLAVDLYRGKVAKDVEEAHILSRAIPEEQVRADLKEAVDHLIKRSGRSSVAVIGWELGGGYALDLAMEDSRVSACVNCYGRLTTDAAALAKMKASFLGIYAAEDRGNPPETLRDFREAMKESKRDLAGLHVFEKCDGGFMNPGPDRKPGPTDSEATQKAWGYIDEFLSQKLT
jgi:carboxymethylenebutenolidase